MSDYLDAALAPRDGPRMQRHLGECQDCRRLLADLRLIVGRLHGLVAPSDGAEAPQIVASVRLRLKQPPSA